ncbi:MAG: dienelactone hydrolase family protein [Ilumatobacteraceae bacterium]
MSSDAPDSTPAPLTVRRPSGQLRGGVIVVQEAFGVNEHIEDVCQRIADAGWLAVAPHMFHRTGDPSFAYDIDFSVLGEHMVALGVEGIAADIAVARQFIIDAGVEPSAVGIVGFCMGGTVAMATACTGDVAAAVTFYGGGVARGGRFGYPSLIDLAPSVQVPWLGLYGDLDTGIPVDEVEALRHATSLVDVPTEIVRYADAAHGFNCDRRASYHAESASDAWARMLAWFDQYLD